MLSIRLSSNKALSPRMQAHTTCDRLYLSIDTICRHSPTLESVHQQDVQACDVRKQHAAQNLGRCILSASGWQLSPSALRMTIARLR